MSPYPDDFLMNLKLHNMNNCYLRLFAAILASHHKGFDIKTFNDRQQ